MEFSHQKDENGDPVECECCGYPAAVREFSKDDDKGTTTLCEICSSTHFSVVVEYQRNYGPETRYLFGGLGWIANRLLDEIRNKTHAE